MKSFVQVVAAIIRRGENEVLLGQRPAGAHLQGLWEFPGGKIETRETPADALQRELKEELGIDIVTSFPLMTVRHQYPEKQVELHIREVMGWEGQVTSMEKQQLQWVNIKQLAELEMPAADKPVIPALKLSRTYQVTPGLNDVAAYVEFLCKAIKSHSSFIQLRPENLSSVDLEKLLGMIAGIKHRSETVIILHSGEGELRMNLANQVDGLHLTAKHLLELKKRPAKLDGFLLASCRNLAEVRQAEKIGVDMLCLAPVYSDVASADLKPLGEQGFADICEKAILPVYAMGGMKHEHMSKIRDLGGTGIAGIDVFERW